MNTNKKKLLCLILELFGDGRHCKTIANVVIIQLVHSFEVNIRICQSKNSYVHRGEHHFRVLTNPDVYRKRMHKLFCYMTLSLFS